MDAAHPQAGASRFVQAIFWFFAVAYIDVYLRAS
jgi:hypothetical protein